MTLDTPATAALRLKCRPVQVAPLMENYGITPLQGGYFGGVVNAVALCENVIAYVSRLPGPSQAKFLEELTWFFEAKRDATERETPLEWGR